MLHEEVTNHVEYRMSEGASRNENEPIEPRYRIDIGQTVLDGEARSLAQENRN